MDCICRTLGLSVLCPFSQANSGHMSSIPDFVSIQAFLSKPTCLCCSQVPASSPLPLLLIHRYLFYLYSYFLTPFLPSSLRLAPEGSRRNTNLILLPPPLSPSQAALYPSDSLHPYLDSPGPACQVPANRWSTVQSQSPLLYTECSSQAM